MNDPHQYGGGPPGYGGPPLAPRPTFQARHKLPLEIRNPSALKTRSAVVVVVLSLVSCGLYYLYWLYATGCELRDALVDQEIKPAQDLLLCVLTCSLWGIYVTYRNAQKTHAALLSRDTYAKDQSETIMLLNVAALFVGVTGLIATFILQEELNKLAALSQTGFAPANA